MYRQILWTAALGFASVTTVSAQAPTAQKTSAMKPEKPMTMEGPAGNWNGKTMIGPKDSVIATYSLTIAPDGKAATIKFPNREAMTARIVTMGGDSIVTEVGPYPSILRPGETVTSLRNTSHYKGDKMWGTFEAKYAKGELVKGKTEATRGM